MFNFTVNNFRSFLNQKFHFSRVNILIGENSGGKSSLLKLLLALKQTMDSPTEGNLKLSGDLTNLGNYDEVVYYKKKNRKISIAFESLDKYFYYFETFFNSYESKKMKVPHLNKLNALLKDSVTEVFVEFSSKLDDHSTIKTTFKNSVIGSLELVQKKGDELTSRRRACDLKFEFEEVQDVIEDCYSYKEGFFTFLDTEIRQKCETNYGSNGDKVYYRLAYLLILQNYIQDEIERFKFVNPIGTSPKRFYFQEDKKTSYSVDIEGFINILSDNSLSQKAQEERISLLNKTLKDFGIAEEVEIIKDKQLPVLALNVKTKDFWSNITDVGYGVSLQLPIIFQALISENYTKKGQTLLIEQPEVHLHPSLQAKFIDTLLSMGSKNTYFIETHSEHIVRKLQVLVKNGEYGLRPEDISIHYFKREPLKFSITSHTISSNGQLTPSFPKGFFDTSYSLVKELM